MVIFFFPDWNSLLIVQYGFILCSEIVACILCSGCGAKHYGNVLYSIIHSQIMKTKVTILVWRCYVPLSPIGGVAPSFVALPVICLVVFRCCLCAGVELPLPNLCLAGCRPLIWSEVASTETRLCCCLVLHDLLLIFSL